MEGLNFENMTYESLLQEPDLQITEEQAELNEFRQLMFESVDDLLNDRCFEIETEDAMYQILKGLPESSDIKDVIKWLDQREADKMLGEVSREFKEMGYIPIKSEAELKKCGENFIKNHKFKAWQFDTKSMIENKNNHNIRLSQGLLELATMAVVLGGFQALVSAIASAGGGAAVSAFAPAIRTSYRVARGSLLTGNKHSRHAEASSTILGDWFFSGGPINQWIKRLCEGTKVFTYKGYTLSLITHKGIFGGKANAPESRYLYAAFRNKNDSTDMDFAKIAQQSFGKRFLHRLVW